MSKTPTPLPDAQVAALATPCGGRWERFKSHIEIDGDTIEPSCGEVIQSLATEVLATRARRCGDCQHWDREGWADSLDPQLGTCRRHHHPCADANFFCADFTPTEGR